MTKEFSSVGRGTKDYAEISQRAKMFQRHPLFKILLNNVDNELYKTWNNHHRYYVLRWTSFLLTVE
jgi:hypothetical protein